MSDGIGDGMINKTKPYNKSTGIQGIGDTVNAYDLWDMNQLTDPIEKNAPEKSGAQVKPLNKNS